MSANTLLIVEDSHVQAKIIRNQFESLTDFQIVTAHSMAEAEQALAQHKDSIFAAILDLNLPDAPHGEVVDVCRKHGTTAVVLTASFDEKLRHQFLEKRVADYFLKGSVDDMEPLLTCIERLHANRKIKALIVDDSATQRNLLKQLLSVQGIQSEEAKDGIDALAKLQQDPTVQLVITDFQMPNMDGIELVREIRAKHKLHRMVVIGLSATGSGPLTASFLKNGANDFLTKPFEVEEFYWRVNQNLNMLALMEELHEYRKQK